MQLVVKTDDKAQAMIQAMNDAGWVMYINGEEVALQGGSQVHSNSKGFQCERR